MPTIKWSGDLPKHRQPKYSEETKRKWAIDFERQFGEIVYRKLAGGLRDKQPINNVNR